MTDYRFPWSVTTEPDFRGMPSSYVRDRSFDGPSLEEIVQLSRDFQEAIEIMEMVFEKLTDRGKMPVRDFLAKHKATRGVV